MTTHDLMRQWLAAGTAVAHATFRLTQPDAPLTVAPPPAWPEPTLDPWSYVTTERLVRDTTALIAGLPPDIDAVVAVARSGLIPGTLAATLRHLPLWTVSRGRGIIDPGHGHRMRGHSKADPRHVLLIDDTAASGREMPANTATVRQRWPAARITRAVIYCHPEARPAVDTCAMLYPGFHYLEWNWQNAGHGVQCGFDFDGILCRDDDGSRPLFLPARAPVPLIVTGRHESARTATEAWLARWGVRCDRLVMRDFDAPDHYDLAAIAAMKAREYATSACVLFAESDPGQAEAIARLAGKPVLCPAAVRVFPPPAAEPPAAEPPPVCRHRHPIAGCGCYHCARFSRKAPAELCEDCPEIAP